MIPKYLLPKEPVTETNCVNANISFSTKKVECSNCHSEKFEKEKGFIILKKDGDRFLPICTKCAQIRMLGNIVYIEDYPTFAKRLKTNQFKDWKVVYEEDKRSV